MKRQQFKTVGAIAVSGLLLLMVAGWGKMTQMEAALAGMWSTKTESVTQAVDASQSYAVAQSSNAMTDNLVDANTRFGFKLFSAMTKGKENSNVFISPSSVAIALAMVYNGANGRTQAAMARTLEVQGMSLPDLNRANANLKTLLQNPDPQVQLTIANSLWTRRGVSFKPNFIQQNSQFYQAKVTELDFGNPQSIQIINQWVSQNTQGKITEIVDRLSPSQLMLLVNAIYFKGSWTRKFDLKQTTIEPFYQPNGTSKKHPLMTQQGNYFYHKNDLLQAVRLPYGKGERISMVILLPKKGAGLPGLQQKLNAETWMQWMGQMRRRQGAIKLPRFKVEYDTELTGVLSQLGMGQAFSSNADFSKLSDVPAEISEVKHKTFVEVNEEGTEAAAVTSIGIRATSVQVPQEPFSVIVNRPFFCAIMDDQTGSVLFMGAIVDPKQ